jgi:hypothetical protein
MSRPTKSTRLKPFYAMFSVLIVMAGLLAACESVGQAPSANSAPTKVTGQPRLSVDRTQVDFGKVPMDKMVKATFIVTNIGDKPLQIMGEPTVKVAKGC